MSWGKITILTFKGGEREHLSKISQVTKWRTCSIQVVIVGHRLSNICIEQVFFVPPAPASKIAGLEAYSYIYFRLHLVSSQQNIDERIIKAGEVGFLILVQR